MTHPTQLPQQKVGKEPPVRLSLHIGHLSQEELADCSIMLNGVRFLPMSLTSQAALSSIELFAHKHGVDLVVSPSQPELGPLLPTATLAQQFGAKHYFPNEQCKNGHVSAYYVNGNRCMTCQTIRNWHQRAKKERESVYAMPEEWLELVKNFFMKHPYSQYATHKMSDHLLRRMFMSPELVPQHPNGLVNVDLFHFDYIESTVLTLLHEDPEEHRPKPGRPASERGEDGLFLPKDQVSNPAPAPVAPPQPVTPAPMGQYIPPSAAPAEPQIGAVSGGIEPVAPPAPTPAPPPVAAPQPAPAPEPRSRMAVPPPNLDASAFVPPAPQPVPEVPSPAPAPAPAEAPFNAQVGVATATGYVPETEADVEMLRVAEAQARWQRGKSPRDDFESDMFAQYEATYSGDAASPEATPEATPETVTVTLDDVLDSMTPET